MNTTVPKDNMYEVPFIGAYREVVDARRGAVWCAAVTAYDTETGLPIALLHDRLLVRVDSEGERRSAAGIVIPATASIGHRLSWARAVAVGPLVRSVQVEDRVCSTRTIVLK